MKEKISNKTLVTLRIISVIINSLRVQIFLNKVNKIKFKSGGITSNNKYDDTVIKPIS